MTVSGRFAAGLVTAACLWVMASGSADAATSLNLSHDLVTLGIAAQNLTPDIPALDARPLIQAGLDYARTHAITVVTADHGAYYLLTPGSTNYYITLYSASNLTLDFAGSTLFLKRAGYGGIIMGDGQHLTLTNFTVDFLEPPYTHVQITSVDAAGKRLFYTPLPGWASPTTFTGTSPFGPNEHWAMAFRNGTILPGTSRIGITLPISAGVLNVLQEDTPWTQPATLATLQPGDTLVVTERGGEPPVKSVNGNFITFSNITILGSGSWALQSDHDRNSLMDHVTVKPRPGTGLVGSNADGIHFGWSRANNHIRNCFVAATIDDAIALDALKVATVVSQSDARHVRVKRLFYEPFPTGSAINFVDPATSREIPAGHLIVQTPSDATVPVFDGLVDLTFDQDVPALVAGTAMAFGSADMRAGGSSIEDNVVGGTLFGRGIWLSGVMNVLVARNTVGPTSNGGIVVWGHSRDAIDAGPPSHDVIIEDNTITGSLGPMAQGSGTQFAMAAIVVSSTDSEFRFVPVASNSHITIRRNTIVSSGRGGIWVAQVDGGVIQENQVVSWNTHPELPIWGTNVTDTNIAREDFKQSTAIRFSTNITSGGPQRSQFLAEGATGVYFDTQLACSTQAPPTSRSST